SLSQAAWAGRLGDGVALHNSTTSSPEPGRPIHSGFSVVTTKSTLTATVAVWAKMSQRLRMDRAGGASAEILDACPRRFARAVCEAQPGLPYSAIIAQNRRARRLAAANG